MIELKNLCAGYREKTVLQNIDLMLNDGSFTAVIGKNGSGKSTLLKAIAQLIPHEGDILVDGEASLPRKELAKRLAYVPQARNVPALTAERMVLHGRFPHLGYPRRYREADYAIASEALARFGMGSCAHTPIEELSGGERQKVCLAMAFAQQAQNILLDEPLTYLDIRAQLELMEALRTLAEEGRTVLAALHDLDLALRFADRIAVLHEGRILVCGSAEEVLASHAIETAFSVRAERVGDAYVFQK